MSDSLYHNLLLCSNKQETQLADINQFRAKLYVLSRFCEKNRRYIYRNKEMEEILNSSVLNWITCHHYKRQIRKKMSTRPTGSLIRRRLKYFLFHPWNIFVWQKLFIEFSMRRGRLLFISVFSLRSCLFLSVSCYPETLNNYSFAQDVSWKVTA